MNRNFLHTFVLDLPWVLNTNSFFEKIYNIFPIKLLMNSQQSFNRFRVQIIELFMVIYVKGNSIVP